MLETSFSNKTSLHIPNGVFAVISCLLWSTAFVGIKIGYTAGATPLFFAGLRFFISGAVLIPLVVRSLGRETLITVVRENFVFMMIIGIFQTFLLYSAFYHGVALVPASVAAIVIGSEPLITSVVSHALPPREKMAGRQWVSLVLAMAGLVILSMSRNSSGGQTNSEILGIVFLLLAMTSSTVSSLWVSRTKRKIPPLALSSGQFLFGGALLLLISLPVEGVPRLFISPAFWGALAWLVTVSSVGISLWFWLLRHRGAGPGALSVWKFIVPVAGAVVGWIFMAGDSPDLGSVVGMILIGGSVTAFFIR